MKQAAMRRPTWNDNKNTKCFYEFYSRYFDTRVLPMWLNKSLNDERGNHSWASYTDDQII